MISAEKLAANQANATHSTGPKTPEGKARSAQNSRTHGLCAQDIIIAAEDREEFESMQLSYQIEVSPCGAIETTLFEELVRAAWNLRRIGRMETEACAGHDSDNAILDDEALQQKLDRLARHKTRIALSFHRSLKELKALQTLRSQQQQMASEDRMRHPPLAAVPRNAKRSQIQPTAPAHEPDSGADDPEFEQYVAEYNRRAAEIFARVTQNQPNEESQSA